MLEINDLCPASEKPFQPYVTMWSGFQPPHSSRGRWSYPSKRSFRAFSVSAWRFKLCSTWRLASIALLPVGPALYSAREQQHPLGPRTGPSPTIVLPIGISLASPHPAAQVAQCQLMFTTETNKEVCMLLARYASSGRPGTQCRRMHGSKGAQDFTGGGGLSPINRGGGLNPAAGT